MHRRTARGNRLGLALTGALLLIAGLALVGANRGSFGAAGPREYLYGGGVRRFVADNRTWLWPVVAAVAVVVGLAFLRWLLVQTRVDAVRTVRVDSETADSGTTTGGRTRMPAAALTDAVEADLGAVRGVRRANARLCGAPDRLELWLEITADADADLGRIRTHVAHTVIADARTCLELDAIDTYLSLGVSRRSSARR